MALLKLVPPHMLAKKAVGQLSLFEDRPKPNLCILSTAALEGSEFFRAVDLVRPGVVFDLRPVPRFNFAGTNRRKVLATFQDRGCAYVDVTGIAGILSSHDVRLKPARAAALMREGFAGLGRGGQWTGVALMLLFDNVDLATRSAQELPPLLNPAPEGGWRVAVAGVPRVRAV